MRQHPLRARLFADQRIGVRRVVVFSQDLSIGTFGAMFYDSFFLHPRSLQDSNDRFRIHFSDFVPNHDASRSTGLESESGVEAFCKNREREGFENREIVWSWPRS